MNRVRGLNMRRWVIGLGIWLGLAGWVWGETPSELQLPARQWLLVDFTTGEVLAEHGADERAEPASITKVMSAYLVFSALRDGRLKWNQTVPISQKAWKMTGSRMFVEPRHSPTVEELVKGMVIPSGNDATVALAEAVAGSEEAFVAQMNAKAKEFGLTATRFVDSSGMPHPDHVTTARDLARLAIRLIRDFPEEYRLFREKEFVYNKIRQANRNRLLWLDPSVDGIKTGHTQSAGYCLLASAERNGRRLVGVTLGSSSEADRVDAMLKLLNYGFQNFDHFKVARAEQAVAELRVWKGASERVAVGVLSDAVVTLPRTALANAAVRFVGVEPLVAPVRRGQEVGRLEVVAGETVLRSVPAVALADVREAGWWGRLVDGLRLRWRQLWGR
ncbi:MAG: D-alanyl-D-alanine carboxypeptidase [Hydrogenophilus sp.]|nr:D-alanyl-D-alanine carboxypeptidase [Hydrogenophilus sp.]